MKTRVVITLLGAFVLQGCALQRPSATPAVTRSKGWQANDKEQRALMAGKWFSDMPTTDGGRRLEVCDMHLDGSFTIRFRTIEKSGKSEDAGEFGMWGAAGNIYFTITEGWLKGDHRDMANPESAYLNDAYQILDLSKDQFHYKSLGSSANEYTETRVPDSFELPAQ